MERDARKMRGTRPFVFTNLKNATGLPEVMAWLERHLATPERRDLIDAHAAAAAREHNAHHHHAPGDHHH
jgi:hypothetical protein